MSQDDSPSYEPGIFHSIPDQDPSVLEFIDFVEVPEVLVVAEPVQPQPQPEPTPWGFWVTMGFSLLVIFAYFMIQTVVVVAFILAQPGLRHAQPREIEKLAASGLMLSVAEWITAPLCLALVLLLARLRGRLPLDDYFALKPVRISALMICVGVLLAFVAVADATSWLLGHDVESGYMIEAYRTAVVLPLFWAALVVAAPIFEEMFFRGFMFRGIQQSELGSAGAILITSLVWSAMHVQYNLYQMSVIFVVGVFLGIARTLWNSTWLTIVLHALFNVIAIIEVEVYLRCTTGRMPVLQ